MGKYFGTDGFRGEAGVALTAAHAFLVGRFLGWWGQEKGKKIRVAVGKDTRRSSYMLEYALAAGLCASGADAYLLHVTTTPNVCYTVATEHFDMGVMISASHNPFADNGIKLIAPGGAKAEDALTDKIEQYLSGDLAALGVSGKELPFATGGEIGRIFDYEVARMRYFQHLVSTVHVELADMRVGLDCANGAASAIAPAVFTALGARAYAIHTTPDGLNINRNAGALHPELLAAHVREHRLDVGFAFDGDADRCIAVDATGKILNGDHLLYLLATDLKEKGALLKNTVVTTVMSNLGLYQALAEKGIDTVQTAVGDRFVSRCMREGGYTLGGEQAGHVIFADQPTMGDGILTALKVMEIMVSEGKSLAELVAPLRILPQITRNIHVPDKCAVCENGGVLAAIERVRARLLDGGRVLVRPSGTESVVRVMIEGESEGLCHALADEIVAAIEKSGPCA